MSTSKSNQPQQPKKAHSATVGDVEKQYNIKLQDATASMSLATYFIRRGLPALGKVMKKTEQHLAQSS